MQKLNLLASVVIATCAVALFFLISGIGGCTTGKATIEACAVVAERCTTVRAFSGEAAVRAAQLTPGATKDVP